MDQAEQVAPLLKALADPVRLRLMSLVASHQGDRDKRGVWVYYAAVLRCPQQRRQGHGKEYEHGTESR